MMIKNVTDQDATAVDAEQSQVGIGVMLQEAGSAFDKQFERIGLTTV